MPDNPTRHIPSDHGTRRNALVAWLDRIFYPQFDDNWDDALFRDQIWASLEPWHQVLDLGAGAGIVAQLHFKGHVARVCGLDPDERVLRNPHLDEARIGIGERIPWEDQTFDVVFADNVLEHLLRPREVFAEVARVLKPGGQFLIKTPNRRHYMPLIARWTPNAFHRWFNSLRGRSGHDTFPTLYFANCRTDIQALASSVGCHLEDYHQVEGRPEYLRFSPLTYSAGLIYERIVNNVPQLSSFRLVIYARIRKNP